MKSLMQFQGTSVLNEISGSKIIVRKYHDTKWVKLIHVAQDHILIHVSRAMIFSPTQTSEKLRISMVDIKQKLRVECHKENQQNRS